jgi:hypothetical protein
MRYRSRDRENPHWCDWRVETVSETATELTYREVLKSGALGGPTYTLDRPTFERLLEPEP